MAKKHKHEEHVNHERWVISFADMMTLLFALFVVLYALGTVELRKLKDLKKSIQFAFHIAGEGKTRDTGIFDKQQGGGEVNEAAPLMNAQSGEMREFLDETLREFQEVAGKSLDIQQTDDSVNLVAPLSKFFESGKRYPVKKEVLSWLGGTIDASLNFTSFIRIVIESPELVIGETRDGDRTRPALASDLCLERLKALRKVVSQRPDVRGHMVAIEFREQKETGGGKGDWEDRARVTISFANRH